MEVQVPGGAAPLQEGESLPHVLPVRQPRLQVNDITIITWTSPVATTTLLAASITRATTFTKNNCL